LHRGSGANALGYRQSKAWIRHSWSVGIGYAKIVAGYAAGYAGAKPYKVPCIIAVSHCITVRYGAVLWGVCCRV